jgi:hypothetical protein
MLQGIVTLVAIAAFSYGVFRFVRNYREAQGLTTWERLLAAAKDSATVLWSYTVLLGGYIITGLAYGADFLNLPEVRDLVQESLPPEVVGPVLVVIAAMTFVARLRTLRAE